jgi:hypothetical protein
MTNSRLERALNLIEKMKRRKRMEELKSLPQLVDWSPFLMVLEHGDSVWIGVGPDHSTYIENYAGWKYVSKVGSPPGGMPSSSVPGTPDRCGGCWWNISADSANLKNIIDKVRRLVASDQREFIYIKNGVPIIGNLPEAQSLGRARLVTFVERQILVFPKMRLALVNLLWLPIFPAMMLPLLMKFNMRSGCSAHLSFTGRIAACG